MEPDADNRIVALADRPELVPVVAGWVYHEWLEGRPGFSRDVVERKFQGHLQHGTIPLTLVALHGDTPIGTASIYVHDMDIRPSLSPWLAAVYVVPGRRGRGIGSRLVMAIEFEARQLGIERLYLFTPDREQFYTRIGWMPYERVEYLNEPVVVMTKELLKV